MEILREALSIWLLVIGLSYLLQSRAWARIGRSMVEAPDHMMLVAVISLPFGVALLAVHNIWVADLTVVFTIVAWIIVVKMILLLLSPNLVQSFSGLSEAGMRKMVMVAGAVMTVVGVLLVYRFVISA